MCPNTISIGVNAIHLSFKVKASVQSLHFFSCHCDMTSQLVTSSITASFWGEGQKGRVRGVCVCVCGSVCLCVRDPSGAPMIARLSEGRQARRRLRGPPFSTILGFCLLTAVAELSCVLVCLCAVSVSLVHSFHSYLAGGGDSCSFLISPFL